MSTPTPANASSIKVMQALVIGKIENVRLYEKKVYTTVISPAADPYSSPSVLQLRSDKRIGQRDEEIKVLCKLGGHRRKAFKAIDKETGEVSMVVPIEMTLDVVES